MVKLAIEKNAGYLEYASYRLKDNDEIVRLAIERQHGIALDHASVRLKKKRIHSCLCKGKTLERVLLSTSTDYRTYPTNLL